MKLGKALLALACVSMAAAAYAEEAPYTTFHVRLEQNPILNEITPAPSVPVTKENVSFHFINNTGKPVYFVNGNNKAYIPVISENTVTIPYTQQEYSVVDAQGNTLSSWHLGPYQPIKADVVSATSEQFENWGEQLQAVIRSAQNRTVSSDWHQQETMPMAQPSNNTPVERHQMIRGYW